MALTKEQWQTRLKNWIPSWYSVEDASNMALLSALAELLTEAQLEVEGMLEKTYLDTATGSWLDLHGSERGVTRYANEEDSLYRERVRTQNLTSQCNPVALETIINALLTRGPCVIREDVIDGPYLSRGTYADRDEYLFDAIKSAFTIIVPQQQHDPYAFYSRGAYASREDFIGSEEAASSIYDNVVKTVDNLKAFGVLYRIVESLNTKIV